MPDLSEIAQTAADLSEIFGEFRDNGELSRDLYEGDMKIPVPDGNYHKHIPPTARAKLDSQLEHTIVNHPTIIVTHVRPPGKSDEDADALEHASDAYLQRLDIGRPENMWREGAKLALLDGISFIKGPLWLKSHYGDEPPKRRRGESENDHAMRERAWKQKTKHYFPVFAQVVPASNVLWVPGQWPQDFYIELTEITAKKANALYNLSLDASNKEMVLLLEYWDVDMRAILIVDKTSFKDYRIHEIRERWTGLKFEKRKGMDDNILGFMPYTPISGGYGTKSNKPEIEFQGLLVSSASSLEAEARLKTDLQAIIETHALPKRWAEEEMAGVKIGGLGTTSEVPAGWAQRTGYVDMPQLPPDIWRMMGVLMQDTEKALGPDALQGMRSPGEVTIGQQASRIGQGTLKVQNLLESENKAGSQFLDKTYRLIDAVNEELPVWGIQGDERLYDTLKPGKLADYSAHLSFDPVPPEMEDRRINLAIALKQSGLLDDETIRERFLKEKDNQKIVRRLMTQDVMASEIMKQTLAAMGADEAGMADMMAVAQGIGGASGGGGGRPVNPRESDIVRRFSERRVGAGQVGSLGTVEEMSPGGGRT